jgi:uncharacterized protein YyaL (SSP411 family)
MLIRTPSPPARVGHVRWHEWGEPALARARSEGIPVLLWIRCGHSRCGCAERFHSLDRPTLNAVIRERFVGVAVDADTRPDVVETCQRLGDVTGRPGCPAAIVLTPGGHPFHVLAADALIRDPDGAAALLERVADDVADRPRALATQAAGIVTLLGLVTRIASPTRGIDAALLDCATGALRAQLVGGEHSLAVPALAFLVARGAGRDVARALRSGVCGRCGATAQLTSLHLRVWRATGDPRFRRTAQAGAARLAHGLRESDAAGSRGLVVASLADAAHDLDDPALRSRAVELAASSLRALAAGDGRLRRFPHGGTGQLEDYAGMAHGLVRLHASTGERRWLKTARELAITAVDRFADPLDGGFFRTEVADVPLVLRCKDLEDRPGPSGNSLLASVLLDLAERLREDVASRSAAAALRLVVDEADAAPAAFGQALLTIDAHRDRLT